MEAMKLFTKAQRSMVLAKDSAINNSIHGRRLSKIMNQKDKDVRRIDKAGKDDRNKLEVGCIFCWLISRPSIFPFIKKHF